MSHTTVLVIAEYPPEIINLLIEDRIFDYVEYISKFPSEKPDAAYYKGQYRDQLTDKEWAKLKKASIPKGEDSAFYDAHS